MDKASDPDATEITALLARLEGEDHATAMARLLPLVYDELKTLSRGYLRGERANHTLQATALVHEAYMRLAEGKTIHFEDRGHFFRTAARIMRQILIGHARKHTAAKRGGGDGVLALEELSAVFPELDVSVLDLDAALEGLAAEDHQKASVVELRFFAGCTIQETAETLAISTATVEREWRFARAWLYRRLESMGEA